MQYGPKRMSHFSTIWLNKNDNKKEPVPYKNLGIVTGLPYNCSKIVVVGNKLAAIMILMAVLSQACWECSYLSITRLLQAVLLSDFNYKLVAIY